MYKGTNPTALRSQQWIMEALLSMMKEKPYAAITVRDLCRRADLSRQTFYNLYESKEDILHAYLRSEVEKVYAGLREKGHPQLDDMVEAFTQVLESNRGNLRLMTSQGLGGIIAEEIAAAVLLFAGSFVDREEKRTALRSASVVVRQAPPEPGNGESGIAASSYRASADADASEGKDGKEMTYAAAFLSGGLAHTLLLWTREDEPLQREELTQILKKILQGEMYRL